MNGVFACLSVPCLPPSKPLLTYSNASPSHLYSGVRTAIARVVAEPCAKAALEALAKPALRADGIVAMLVVVAAAEEDASAGERTGVQSGGR